MGATEAVIEGVLTEDGQLILDERPNLPPGRVRVAVQAVSETPETGETMFDVLERIWAEQDARGFRGRPVNELLAELDAMRDEWGTEENRLSDGTGAPASSQESR